MQVNNSTPFSTAPETQGSVSETNDDLENSLNRIKTVQRTYEVVSDIFLYLTIALAACGVASFFVFCALSLAGAESAAITAIFISYGFMGGGLLSFPGYCVTEICKQQYDSSLLLKNL